MQRVEWENREKYLRSRKKVHFFSGPITKTLTPPPPSSVGFFFELQKMFFCGIPYQNIKKELIQKLQKTYIDTLENIFLDFFIVDFGNALKLVKNEQKYRFLKRNRSCYQKIERDEKKFIKKRKREKKRTKKGKAKKGGGRKNGE